MNILGAIILFLLFVFFALYMSYDVWIVAYRPRVVRRNVFSIIRKYLQK